MQRPKLDRKLPTSSLFYKGVGLGGACLMLAALPVLIFLGLLFVSCTLLTAVCFVILAVVILPLAVLLNYFPKMHLLGYETLKISTIKRVQIPKNGNGAAAKVNSNGVLSEISSLLSLSDLVYMYLDFRRLSILGNMPVLFEHIMLESDKMSQLDTINAVPHREKAFGTNNGDDTGGAGIRPSILFVTVLKFLVSKAEEQRINGLENYLLGAIKKKYGDSRECRGEPAILADSTRSSNPLSRLPSFGRAPKSSGGRDHRKSMFGEMRTSLTHGLRSSLTTLEKAQGGKEQWHGLKMFEDLFLQSLLKEHSSRACSDHHLGGTLCNESGLHGMQCFIDALVERSKEGCPACDELIHLLIPDDEEQDTRHAVDLDAEIAKIGKLLCNIVGQKGVLKVGSILYTTIMDIENNDSRIVWTNDRMGDAECCYIIVVSRQKKRVTVIFRGTTTLNDIMKNADFDILLKDNPISGTYPGKDDSIEINNGYGSYIFVERADNNRTKFDEISDRIHEYGEELGGGYSVHVTGHSMGGALAVLFAFYASLDIRFAQRNNPVCVYTFAAAIPGRISFAKAFQHQERTGLIQHLRIANEEDIVPLAHPQSIRSFAHTGISLILHHDEKLNVLPSFKYVSDPSWWYSWGANLQTNILLNFPWLSPLAVGFYHGCDTYAKRIEQVKAYLTELGFEQLTLNDLYLTCAGINTVSINDLVGQDERTQPQAPADKQNAKVKHKLKQFIRSNKFKALKALKSLKELPSFEELSDEAMSSINRINIPDEFLEELNQSNQNTDGTDEDFELEELLSKSIKTD